MGDFSNLSFNIAVALCGDMGGPDKDLLHQFLRSEQPVSTDDHTETVLINAVKNMVQNSKSGGFSIDQISSPHGSSFLRVDASIWIGTPQAPMGWEVPSIKQGWHKHQRLGTLKYVGHPAIRHDFPLTPPSEDNHKGENGTHQGSIPSGSTSSWRRRVAPSPSAHIGGRGKGFGRPSNRPHWGC